MTEDRALLAGGCFWGVQDLFRRYDGIVSTRVGYTGGDTPNATYRNHGTHAEAVEIVFDPDRARRPGKGDVVEDVVPCEVAWTRTEPEQGL